MQDEIIRRVQSAIADAAVNVSVDGNRALIEVISRFLRSLIGSKDSKRCTHA